MLDPRLEPLADVIVELLVRELETETPSLPGKQDDGVMDDEQDEYTRNDDLRG